MPRISKPALALGLLALLPFLWGAASVLSPGLAQFGAQSFGPLFTGTYLSLTYGTVVLSFMSGILWGFVAKSEHQGQALGYALSAIPALWAFFMVNGDPANAAVNLAAGFAGMLLLDGLFVQRGLAPAWWLRFRIGLTTVVLLCLAVPIITGR